MEHILLPVLNEERTVEVSKETLEVEPTPEGLRLLHSPALVDGLAGGDIIALDPDTLRGFRLILRGRNVAVVVIFPSVEQRDSAEAVVSTTAAQFAGVCDGGPDRVLVCTVPVAAGFPKIEASFNAIAKQYSGATWYFGNVYGPDQHPLGWWSET